MYELSVFEISSFIVVCLLGYAVTFDEKQDIGNRQAKTNPDDRKRQIYLKHDKADQIFLTGMNLTHHVIYNCAHVL